MIRNQRGGKAYKKGSKGKAKEAAAAAACDGGAGRFESPDRDQGVDYARILRALGNRRMLCFCNDGVERVGKIRGALCKGPGRKKIEIGDIVLVSYRAFMEGEADSLTDDSDDEGGVFITTAHRRGGGTASAAADMTPTAGAATLDSGRKDIADIVHKYESRHWRFIRKESGLHAKLFGEASATTSASAAAEEAEDIFEDRGAVATKGAGAAAAADDDADIDIDAI
jgi:initiation factor 1A